MSNQPIQYNEFENLFNRLYPELCRYAYQIVNDSVVAEDIVQEQFIYLWENRSKNVINSYEAYLYRAVKNKAINYLKSYSKIKSIELDTFREHSETVDQTYDELYNTELQSLIQNAIELLPDKCHTIFHLRRIEELSNKEIAAKLAISEKTVENQMTIALRKIALFLKKYWE